MSTQLENCLKIAIWLLPGSCITNIYKYSVNTQRAKSREKIDRYELERGMTPLLVATIEQVYNFTLFCKLIHHKLEELFVHAAPECFGCVKIKKEQFVDALFVNSIKNMFK